VHIVIQYLHLRLHIAQVTDPSVPEVPRWEFFIGDRPLAPHMDRHKRRGCIAQIAAIEDFSDSGTVVLSREVLDLVQVRAACCARVRVQMFLCVGEFVWAWM